MDAFWEVCEFTVPMVIVFPFECASASVFFIWNFKCFEAAVCLIHEILYTSRAPLLGRG
jgi:hypothetical protein